MVPFSIIFVGEFCVTIYNKREVKLSDVRSYLLSQSSAFDYDDIDNINIDNLKSNECTRNPQSSQDFADCWESS